MFGTAQRSTAKAQHGDDLKSKAKAQQRKASTGKGNAEHRPDWQRLSTVSQRYEKARKRYVGNGRAEHRKAMAETGVQWRSNVSNGNDLHGYDLLRR